MPIHYIIISNTRQPTEHTHGIFSGLVGTFRFLHQQNITSKMVLLAWLINHQKFINCSMSKWNNQIYIFQRGWLFDNVFVDSHFTI